MTAYGDIFEKETSTSIINELSSGAAQFSSVGGYVSLILGGGTVVSLGFLSINTLADLIAYFTNTPQWEYSTLIEQDVFLKRTLLEKTFIREKHVLGPLIE